MPDPLDNLAASLEESTLIRYFRTLFRADADRHMKDMTMEAVGPNRLVKLRGRWVVNFGSDSFLGLDQDTRLHDAIRRGVEIWGTHNGASRAFSSVEANIEAETRIAEWLGAESALIYPSVTLANLGAIPALTTRRDVIAVDQYAHHSVQQGVKLAAASGVRSAAFRHNDPDDLARTLERLQPYRNALIAIDGIYSMTGVQPPLREFRKIADDYGAVLYVDDAHGTGVLGEQGRGTVLDALGDYRNVLVVGSLSKALSAFGGFVTAPERVRMLLKLRSGPLIFGGPIPPPYLEAICTAVDIVASREYTELRRKLDDNMARFKAGIAARGFEAMGNGGAIASVIIGDEHATLQTGLGLFERGYYAQSVIFPAVPHRSGLIRFQINASHRPEDIDGLLNAMADLIHPEQTLRESA